MKPFAHRIFAVLVVAAFLVGCGGGQTDEAATGTSDDADEATAEPAVVDVSATEYAFMMPSTVPSGWVTLRFENEGMETHFLQIWRLPEDRTFEEYAEDVYMPFQELYTQYRAGDIDQPTFFEQLMVAVPEWFFESDPMGGPGFTAPGRTSETTVYLEPGDTYVIECYVRAKQDEDRFHGSEGMLRPLAVATEAARVEAPDADIDITVSSAGLEVDGDLTAGSHMARVHVLDMPEGFTRHNVHLVELEDDETAAAAASWLNWVDSMLPPAPSTFLGGASQVGADMESYLAMDLEPGRYAFVSEGRSGDGFIHEFTVE